jgi:hypothetical protein
VAPVWCRVTVVDADGSALACWHEGGAGAPDLAVVDRLARVRLTALRDGGRVAFSDVSAELSALLELVGLGREMRGQPEVGEEPLGVEERVERNDPSA